MSLELLFILLICTELLTLGWIIYRDLVIFKRDQRISEWQNKWNKKLIEQDAHIQLASLKIYKFLEEQEKGKN